MAARSAVGIVTQVGVESTPGTGVSAGKKFSALRVIFNPNLQPQYFRAAGARVPTVGLIPRQWATGNYSGVLDFNHIQYPLASLLGLDAAVSTVETGVYLWEHTLTTRVTNTRKTFTIEQGDGAAAQKITYGAFTSLNLDLGETDQQVSGEIIGQAVNNAATLTSSPTTLGQAPVPVSLLDWYIDSAADFTGEAKWAKVKSAQLSIPTIVAPEMVQNTTYPAFAELVETAVEDVSLTIRTGAETQDRAVFTNMATGVAPFRYVRCQAVGPVLIGATEYPFFKFWAACKLESATMLGGDGGTPVYGYEYKFRLVDNGGSGEFTDGPLKFQVQNTISAL